MWPIIYSLENDWLMAENKENGLLWTFSIELTDFNGERCCEEPDGEVTASTSMKIRRRCQPSKPWPSETDKQTTDKMEKTYASIKFKWSYLVEITNTKTRTKCRTNGTPLCKRAIGQVVLSMKRARGINENIQKCCVAIRKQFKINTANIIIKQTGGQISMAMEGTQTCTSLLCTHIKWSNRQTDWEAAA